MNLNLKDTIEKFFNNTDVNIEGRGVKTWDKDGIAVSLKTDPMKYFVLLTTNRKNIDWIIHFENRTDPMVPFTEEEKFILFEAITDIIQSGDVVTTEGGVTPGGISGLKNMAFHGFKIIDKYSNKDILYWATTLLDREKFDKWIQHANPEDYRVINKEQPLTVENTLPVVKILQKL